MNKSQGLRSIVAKNYYWLKFFLILYLALMVCHLFGCANHATKDGPPPFPVDVSKIHNAVPKCEPKSRIGNPKSYVVFGKRYYVKPSSINYRERGIASWYGMKFHKRRTSNGERFSTLAMTAAHKSLPLPTYVQVTNLENGRRVIVKVNDRGPFYNDRIIDLSYVAAVKLGVYPKGTAMVEVKAIDPRKYHRSPAPVRQIQPAPAQLAQARPQAPGRYVQLGIYRSHGNAMKSVHKFHQLTNLQAHIVPTRTAQGTLYQVTVGPMRESQQRSLLLQKLKNLHWQGTVKLVEA